MNNNENTNYSINVTQENGKILIEYKGKIFKDNPSLITKDTKSVNFKETEEGFIVQIDAQKTENLSFSITNIDKEKILNKEVKDYFAELSEVTALTVVKEVPKWKKIVHYLKKLMRIQNDESIEDSDDY